jgi:hypothetical protein
MKYKSQKIKKTSYETMLAANIEKARFSTNILLL